MSVRFRAAAAHGGFDEHCNPPWQMVPLHGTKTVVLVGGAGLSVVSSDTSIVGVEAERPGAAGQRRVRLRGFGAGAARIEARTASGVRASLDVSVKPERTFRMAFRLVSDSGGHATRRRPQALLDRSGHIEILSVVNRIFLPQTNIRFVAHGAPTHVRVPLDLGVRVMTLDAPDRTEWASVAAHRDSSAHFTVFFVWDVGEFEPPGGNPRDDDSMQAATDQAGNTLLDDRAGTTTDAVGRILAHEAGHLLLLSDVGGRFSPPQGYVPTQQWLMWWHTEPTRHFIPRPHCELLHAYRLPPSAPAGGARP